MACGLKCYAENNSGLALKGGRGGEKQKIKLESNTKPATSDHVQLPGPKYGHIWLICIAHGGRKMLTFLAQLAQLEFLTKICIV